MRAPRPLLTAPFVAGFPETLVRATVSSNGTVTHLQPPEYHGDPAAGSGILCYYHFGWDLLEATRAAGFTKVDMVLPWNPGVGLMGSLWTLTAVR
ncbi:hypothetical protein [Lysobacter panacisoli]|uniref:Uncharacterized protein n=1 Tax=Lysobacter panacisoli TaxID=1255263 RepID=A0ABP9L7H4_9GAMM|nr:hypothetical protein [Lysobacter panacisoli]